MNLKLFIGLGVLVGATCLGSDVFIRNDRNVDIIVRYYLSETSYVHNIIGKNSTKKLFDSGVANKVRRIFISEDGVFSRLTSIDSWLQDFRNNSNKNITYAISTEAGIGGYKYTGSWVIKPLFSEKSMGQGGHNIPSKPLSPNNNSAPSKQSLPSNNLMTSGNSFLDDVKKGKVLMPASERIMNDVYVKSDVSFLDQIKKGKALTPASERITNDAPIKSNISLLDQIRAGKRLAPASERTLKNVSGENKPKTLEDVLKNTIDKRRQYLQEDDSDDSGNWD